MRIRERRPIRVSVLIASEFEPSVAQEAEWLADLPPAQRERIASRPMRRDRHRSLLATRLLLALLRRLGHSRAALATLRHPHRGKPTLDLPLAFSLSHCDGRVAAAVSTDGPVGIDLEAMSPLQASDFAIYLNAGERAWAGASARRFYAVWTRKEAVAKAAGSAGLASLPQIDTSVGADRAAYAGRLWRTAPLALGDGHVGHVAVAGGDEPDLAVQQVGLDALL